MSSLANISAVSTADFLLVVLFSYRLTLVALVPQETLWFAIQPGCQIPTVAIAEFKSVNPTLSVIAGQGELTD